MLPLQNVAESVELYTDPLRVELQSNFVNQTLSFPNLRVVALLYCTVALGSERCTVLKALIKTVKRDRGSEQIWEHEGEGTGTGKVPGSRG